MTELEIYSSVDSISDESLSRLISQSEKALPDCLANRGTGECPLPDLLQVEISVVSDEEIAAVHGEFLDDPTPTDVITFHHGEILISYDTAKRVAREQGHSTEDELLLYIVHGLLHLNGHLDYEESDRKVMHQIQDRIWERVKSEG